MGKEHDDDIELEVDEGAEIETERFADDEDTDEEPSHVSGPIDSRRSDSEEATVPEDDPVHDHDDSM